MIKVLVMRSTQVLVAKPFFLLRQPDPVAEVFGFGVEDVDIEPHLDARAYFAEAGFESIARADIAGVVSDRIEAVGFGDVDRALVLKALADEEDRVEPEDFFRAHD